MLLDDGFVHWGESDLAGRFGNPTDALLGQTAVDAAISTEDVARLAALSDQIGNRLLQLLAGSRIELGAHAVVKSAPHGAAKMLLGFLDVHDINVSGPADDRSLVVRPHSESVGNFFPGAQVDGVHAAQGVGIVQYSLLAGCDPGPVLFVSRSRMS